MPSLDVIFAWTVAVLAAAACIGALVVVLVAEWYAIRRQIEQHRKPGPPVDPTGRWWRERAAMPAPERRP